MAYWSQVEIQEATFDVSDTIEAAMEINKFGISCKNKWKASDCEIEVLNRDLKGFFTSVPQARLIADVETARCRARQIFSSWLNQITVWTVFLGKGKQQCMRGRHSGPGAVHVLDHLVVPVVEHALKTFLFRVGDKVLRQKRGAGMRYLFNRSAHSAGPGCFYKLRRR